MAKLSFVPRCSKEELVADEPNPSRDPGRNAWLHNVWVPIITALIIAAAGIIGAMIDRSTFNQSETTTVVERAAAPEPESSESEPPPSSPSPSDTPEQIMACLQSPGRGDAEDNSIGTPKGPLESGRIYRGTLIKGDEEWLGFCAGSSGRVDIRVENVCEIQGSGATNLLAEIFDSSGEEIESLRPDPGRFKSIPLQVEENSPYYVHIFDLDDIDIGGTCGEVPWSLVVTGDLTSQLST